MSQENPTIFELGPLVGRPSFGDELEGQAANNGLSYKLSVRQLLSAYNGTRLINFVSDIGGDETGNTPCGQLLKTALETLPIGSVLVVPPGEYNAADLTTDIVINTNRVGIVGIGLPQLWLNGHDILLGPNASNFLVRELWLDNGGLGATDVNNVVNNLWVLNNKVTNIVGSGDRRAIDLNIAISNAVVTGNYVNNVESTSSNNAKGIVLGRRDADSLFTQSTNFVVLGNSVSNIRTNATDNTGYAHAIAIYGRNAKVSSNNIFSVVHGSTNIANNTTTGLYLSGHEMSAIGNTLEDAGSHQFIAVDTGTATNGDTVGHPGRIDVSSNILRSRSQQSIRHIRVGNTSTGEGGRVKISENTFAMPNCNPRGVISFDGPVAQQGNIDILDNTIDGGTYAYGISARGSYVNIKRNVFRNPEGPNVATNFHCVYYNPTDTSRDIKIEHNELRIASAWNNNATTTTVVTARDNTAYNVSRLYVRNTVGRTHASIYFEDNETDASITVVDLPVSFDTNSIADGQIFNAIHNGSLAITAASYDLEHWFSGIVVTNDGAAATVTINLPTAIPGVSYSFMRLANFAFRLNPEDNDAFTGEANGKYLEMQSVGVVVIDCYQINKWVVSQATATRAIEP
jgi:hypothetical protein